MVDEEFTLMYQHLGNLREACKLSGVALPENVYDVSAEISTALSVSDGNEEAMKLLAEKFKRGTKREHSALVLTTGAKRSPGTEFAHIYGNDDVKKETPMDLEGEEEEDGEEPPQKLYRLAEGVRNKPAVVASNQTIVNAFADYGEQQLHRGHTGKGVTHLRAARAIRDYPHAITCGKEARAVHLVGPKMATQIEQILLSGKLEDKTPWLNVSSQDEEKHKPPRLVLEVRNAKAKRQENQKLVDELANFGEHELYFRSGSKGTTHLRAAQALQRTDTIVMSGDEARRVVPLVGPAIADKIDQILKHGRIVHDVPSSSAGIRVAPIVTDLRVNPAARSANQPIVDALLDYGDSHLHSGHRGRGITHLRAAKAIRDADVEVTSGEQAMEAIKQVGAQVGAKIELFLKNDHIDSDQDDDDEQGEEGSEFGVREPFDTPPIVHEVRSKPAQLEGNQGLVDALSAHGEMQLAKWHTARGTAFMRAARRLRDAVVLVTSGSVAKAFGGIGDKVVTFIDTMVMFKSSSDDGAKATETSEK